MATDWRVPGFTSTGSKRPDALFGAATPEEEAGLPTRMTRAAGCRVWDAVGREYLDYVMALGAVALGYGHAEVNGAAERAMAAGVAGPPAPRPPAGPGRGPPPPPPRVPTAGPPPHPPPA